MAAELFGQNVNRCRARHCPATDLRRLAKTSPTSSLAECPAPHEGRVASRSGDDHCLHQWWRNSGKLPAPLYQACSRRPGIGRFLQVSCCAGGAGTSVALAASHGTQLRRTPGPPPVAVPRNWAVLLGVCANYIQMPGEGRRLQSAAAAPPDSRSGVHGWSSCRSVICRNTARPVGEMQAWPEWQRSGKRRSRRNQAISYFEMSSRRSVRSPPRPATVEAPRRRAQTLSGVTSAPGTFGTILRSYADHLPDRATGQYYAGITAPGPIWQKFPSQASALTNDMALLPDLLHTSTLPIARPQTSPPGFPEPAPRWDRHDFEPGASRSHQRPPDRIPWHARPLAAGAAREPGQRLKTRRSDPLRAGVSPLRWRSPPSGWMQSR